MAFTLASDTKVAVLMGGGSAEHEVSLSSGAQCLEACRALGLDAAELVIGKEPGARRSLWGRLEALKPDIVLNALHGEWGEDGQVQGVLETFGVAYTHSGVRASALAMDKHRAKAVLREAGVPVAEGLLMAREDAARAHPMEPPYVVKPNGEGSSVGVFLVREGANRPPEALLDPDWRFGAEVVVERFAPGRELTVAVMGDRALTVTDIVAAADWYDYEAKYAAGGSRHIVPADLPAHAAEACLAHALTAHRALGCRGLTRIDFRYDDLHDDLVCLEVNTQPGMTPTSLAPEQAAYCGVSFPELVRWLLEDASCPRS